MILCESEPGNIDTKRNKKTTVAILYKLVNYWLAKQEPSGPRGYSFAELKNDKSTVWDGVHNNLALKHMNNMSKGDLVLFYHTGTERQAVGIMEVTSKPYPNPKEDNKRFIVVDVKYKKPLKRPVTLDEMKKQKKFKDWELIRISRLSVMPVPKDIWDSILEISQK
jgi:predicted RNA-binding protein with PUA-like domain